MRGGCGLRIFLENRRVPLHNNPSTFTVGGAAANTGVYISVWDSPSEHTSVPASASPQGAGSMLYAGGPAGTDGTTLQEPCLELYSGFSSFTEAMIAHTRALAAPIGWHQWMQEASGVSRLYEGNPTISPRGRGTMGQWSVLRDKLNRVIHPGPPDPDLEIIRAEMA